MCYIITNSDAQYFISKLERRLELEPGTLTGPVRKAEFNEFRYALYKLFYRDLNFTLSRIGELFNRDHSTIINGLTQINESAGEFYKKTNGLYDIIKTEFERFKSQMEVV